MEPTVSTDLLDYVPDSTATITASSFIVGSTLQFQVQHVTDPGDDGVYGTGDDILGDNAGAGHEPWSVTDGVQNVDAGVDGELGTTDDVITGDLDGVADGNIITTWHVNPDDSLGATFLLTASNESGQLATTSFTDAAGDTNKVYQHWADGDSQPAEWNNNILSDNKSNYFEGEVIPHVFVFKASAQTPLVNGQSYSFNITYNYYQANTNAGGFDYITTPNLSRTPGQLDVTDPYIAPSTDGLFTNGGGTQGVFHTVDADITNVSGVTYTGTSTKDGHVTVTFIYTGTTTKDGVAEIHYGLHIAQPGAVPDQGAGTTKGASAWSGGSLQTTVDIGGSGATSIQLAPAAIIAGQISGLKFNDLDGDGVRDAGEAGLAGWTIFLDKDADGVLDAGETSTVTGSGGAYSFSVTPDADKSDLDNDPYVVREVQQSGWTQTTANPSAILITAADPTESNVNFGNHQAVPPQLEIAGFKWHDVDNDGIWDFNFGDPAAGEQGLAGWTISIDDDSDPLNGVVASVLTGGDGSYFFDLSLPLDDTYYLYEQLQSGWQQTSDGSATIVVDALGHVTSNPAGAIGDTGGSGALGAAGPLNFGNFHPEPSLNIVKDATVPGGTADVAGELVSYSITVENTGNQTLTDVVVSDPFVSDLMRVADVLGDGDDLLEVGETWGYTATHVVTQADIDTNGGGDGLIDNVATADSEQTDPDSDPAAVPVEQKPAFMVAKSANKNAIDSAGQVITYSIVLTNTGNQTLTGVVADDTLLGALAGPVESLSANGLLNVGETWTYTPTHNVTQSEINENIYTVTFGPSGTYGQQWNGQVSSIELSGGSDGDIDNTVTGDTDQTDPQDASAAVNVAHIDVEKFVSVDGGTTWVDADSPTGPTLISTSGIDPLFKFVVTNTGNVDLSNVVLTDNVFELNGLAGDGNGATAGYGIGDLASGDSTVVTFEDAVWKFGQHSNTGSAAGQYSNGQQVVTVQDSDAAHYFGMLGAVVTNSSLCTFDTNTDLAGDQFNLIFTPDFKLGGSNYKLSGGNPGQFYYNVFFQGDAYEDVDFTLEIPFPFVTQGATPIHVYDDVRVDEESGELCLTPIGEIANFKLTDPGVSWTLVDTNGNGVGDVGENYRLVIEDVDLGDDGFVYLNVHLDYGLEKQTGWVKSSSVSGTDNALDNTGVSGVQPAIMDGHSYDFSALADGYTIDGSSDSIVNDNTFKNIKGLGGLFQADSSATEGLDQTAVAGQHLGIFKSDGSFMGDAWTDEDGWYYAQFNATGSKTNYKVVWDQDGDGNYAEHLAQNDHVKTVEMGGNAGKWVNVDFTVVDPVDTSLGIDSYGSIL